MNNVTITALLKPVLGRPPQDYLLQFLNSLDYFTKGTVSRRLDNATVEPSLKLCHLCQRMARKNRLELENARLSFRSFVIVSISSLKSVNNNNSNSI